MAIGNISMIRLVGCRKIQLAVAIWPNRPYGVDIERMSGCSKGPSSKAAASEEARAYASVR
jgi:hypothetical protein